MKTMIRNSLAVVAACGAIAVGGSSTANAAPVTGGMSPNTSGVQTSIVRANEKAAFDYFVAKGLTKKQAAGIVGNLDQESGVDPTAKQPGGPGRGIAQWSVGGRWDTDKGDNMVAYTKGHGGGSSYNLTKQLDFTWYELTHFSGYGLSALKGTKYVKDATTTFMTKFEGCGDCKVDTRITYADDAYARYK